MAGKAVFLDRDDTLIEDPGYLSDPGQVKIIKGVPEALKELRRLGYKLVVVTNQSAVARGIVTEQVLEQIHARLKELLAQKGVFLDAIYYCPYHPDGAVKRYRRESDWRKPNPGMLLAAAKDMDLDLGQSWVIGDRQRDVEAGTRAGCKTILISRDLYYKQPEPGKPRPDYKCLSLREAVNIIKQHHRTGGPGNKELSHLPGRDRDDKAYTSETNGPENIKTEDISQPAQNQQQDNQEDQPEPDHLSRPGDSPQQTQRLLADILEHLKASRRDEMFSEFSVTRLIAGVVQIVALFCLVVSIWLLLDPKRQLGSVFIAIAFAILFQLMSLTFYLIDRR